MLDSFKAEVDGKTRELRSCNICKRTSIHTVAAKCISKWGDRDFSGGEEYRIVKCGGCDSVRYVTESWDDQALDHDEDGNLYAVVTTKVYPPAALKSLEIGDLRNVPVAIAEIFEETVAAHGGGHLSLATIGARILIERICKAAKATGSNLKAQIDDLAGKNLIDADEQDLLQKVRDHGNGSAHKGTAMNSDQIASSIEISYHLIDKLFAKPARDKALKDKAKKVLGKT